MSDFVKLKAETYVTTDNYVIVREVSFYNQRGKLYKTSDILIRNIGANSARVNILASLDGENFYITLVSGQLLNAGNKLEFKMMDEPYLRLRIEAKSNNVGRSTTIETLGTIVE